MGKQFSEARSDSWMLDQRIAAALTGRTNPAWDLLKKAVAGLATVEQLQLVATGGVDNALLERMIADALAEMDLSGLDEDAVNALIEAAVSAIEVGTDEATVEALIEAKLVDIGPVIQQAVASNASKLGDRITLNDGTAADGKVIIETNNLTGAQHKVDLDVVTQRDGVLMVNGKRVLTTEDALNAAGGSIDQAAVEAAVAAATAPLLTRIAALEAAVADKASKGEVSSDINTAKLQLKDYTDGMITAVSAGCDQNLVTAKNYAETVGARVGEAAAGELAAVRDETLNYSGGLISQFATDLGIKLERDFAKKADATVVDSLAVKQQSDVDALSQQVSELGDSSTALVEELAANVVVELEKKADKIEFHEVKQALWWQTVTWLGRASFDPNNGDFVADVTAAVARIKKLLTDVDGLGQGDGSTLAQHILDTFTGIENAKPENLTQWFTNFEAFVNGVMTDVPATKATVQQIIDAFGGNPNSAIGVVLGWREAVEQWMQEHDDANQQTFGEIVQFVLDTFTTKATFQSLLDAMNGPNATPDSIMKMFWLLNDVIVSLAEVTGIELPEGK
jgi:hypothetical protein